MTGVEVVAAVGLAVLAVMMIGVLGQQAEDRADQEYADRAIEILRQQGRFSGYHERVGIDIQLQAHNELRVRRSLVGGTSEVLTDWDGVRTEIIRWRRGE